MNITALMHDAAATIEVTPGNELAEADLHRGRRAAARLHRRRLASRSAGAVGVAAIAAIVGVTHNPSSAPAVPGVGSAELVAYTGTQPVGFDVDTVPNGWTVQTSDTSMLTIAADGPPASASNPSETPYIGDDLLVDWEIDAIQPIPGAEPVTFHGLHGTYGLMLGDAHTTALTYTDAVGHNIRIQIPPSLHWTASQATAFASGIHVTGAVQPSHG